jgi:hypothetical protein
MVVVALVLACDGSSPPTEPDRAEVPSLTFTSSPRYSGLAISVRATVGGFTQTIVQAGPLPSSGGTQSFSLVGPVKVETLLTASALNASVDGRYRRSISTASLGSLTLRKAGNTIKANKVTAYARAECGNRRSGTSDIYNLTVNGAPVFLTSQPNQTITLPNGKLVINEQVQASTGNSITVTGLRLVINGQADVVVSKAQAGVIC